jgi:hypothetical protein
VTSLRKHYWHRTSYLIPTVHPFGLTETFSLAYSRMRPMSAILVRHGSEFNP